MANSTIAQPVAYEDIQGIVRFGYGPLTEAVFLLLNIRDREAARAWLLTAPVSNAVAREGPPDTALQVAFSREGLEALEVPREVLVEFSPEFLSGMSGHESRARRLGDAGANAPSSWQWGAPESVPHVIVLLYARPGHLEEWKQAVQTPQWQTAFDPVATLSTSDLHGAEPFGFQDGISQPALDWDRTRIPHNDQLNYGNLVCLGEFLLGYPNEYGKYTERPLLDDSAFCGSLLPRAEDVPSKRDLGRNGTYLVVRQLEQDVCGFWRFLDRQTGSDSQARSELAEAMVGRRRNGDPLAPVATGTIEGIDPKTASKNEFTYDADAAGERCPFGAHVRRANPRNADLPAGSDRLWVRLLHILGFRNPGFRDDVIASTRFHRLLRRGREYGAALTPDQAATGVADGGERGIHFMCVAANILRQFEFVQNAWMVGSKFDALSEESDPLLGNREPVRGCPSTDTFSIPQKSAPRRRMMQMPQFVKVRGGGYFFLPSLSALRYIAKVGRKQA